MTHVEEGWMRLAEAVCVLAMDDYLTAVRLGREGREDFDGFFRGDLYRMTLALSPAAWERERQLRAALAEEEARQSGFRLPRRGRGVVTEEAGRVIRFPSVEACARHYGIGTKAVRVAITEGRPLGSGFPEMLERGIAASYDDGRAASAPGAPEGPKTSRSRGVIARGEDGTERAFRDAAECCAFYGLSKASVYGALSKGIAVGGRKGGRIHVRYE